MLSARFCSISKRLSRDFSTITSRASLAGLIKQPHRDFIYSSKEADHEPFYPIPGKKPKQTNAEEATSVIKVGDKVFVQGVAATPLTLLRALRDRANEGRIHDVTLMHLHLEGDIDYLDPSLNGAIKSLSLFTGKNMRHAVNDGRSDYVPVFLSEIPIMFERGTLPVDVALIHVSPPDKHGFCSLGVSVDITRAAVRSAKHVIAQVNPNMPRAHGNGFIHMSHIDFMVNVEDDLPESHPVEINDVYRKIGQLIAHNLVEDEATLQLGIGVIPDAVMSFLSSHKDLGIHTEMFSNGVIDLVKTGVITNAKKSHHQGKIISGFCMGTREVYDFVDDNPQVNMTDIRFVNDEEIVARQSKMTAINSCVEVDLTGQIVSDSIGNKIISGVGGQVDFIRGASMAHDGRGKPIISLAATAKDGKISKIVPYIQEGAGVVTTRAHAHYIVTEYGIASLWGKSLTQRARALIDVAHPDHREFLHKEAYNRFKVLV